MTNAIVKHIDKYVVNSLQYSVSISAYNHFDVLDDQSVRFMRMWDCGF